MCGAGHTGLRSLRLFLRLEPPTPPQNFLKAFQQLAAFASKTGLDWIPPGVPSARLAPLLPPLLGFVAPVSVGMGDGGAVRGSERVAHAPEQGIVCFEGVSVAPAQACCFVTSRSGLPPESGWVAGGFGAGAESSSF